MNLSKLAESFLWWRGILLALLPPGGAPGAVQAHGAVGLPGVGSAPALGAAAVKGQ